MRRFLLGAAALAAVSAGSACSSEEDDGGGSTASCVPSAAECYFAGADGPGAECLAKADNTGQTKWQGRLSSILVKYPESLAGEFVQTTVIDKGISLNQPVCNENGEGTFSWLFEIDSTTSKMKTGGSLPVSDPKAGACFVTLPNAAVPVAPIEASVTLSGNTFSAKGLDVNVPIFLSPTELTNPIILPLHEVEIQATFNDANHNCAGKFNGAELDPNDSCAPDLKVDPPQRAWTPGGSLKGYITVLEADKVVIDDLDSTLCVLLAGNDWKGPAKDCASDAEWVAGKRPDGDWCSQTNAPATAACKDAFKMEADFSASAFKITGDCK
ncbi:MAG: hypothetical protein L6Q84_02390 [Polyangiaceae bacterium]|nr:hypothetical protein [Polyangiaceae bacterium]